MVRTRRSKNENEQVTSPPPTKKKRTRTTSVQEQDDTCAVEENHATEHNKKQRKSKGKEKADFQKIVETEDESDEEEDNIDWETIQLSPRLLPQQETYQDVEIIMDAPLPIKKDKKPHWEIIYQRNLRDWTHNAHIVLLLAHYTLRNIWCSRNETMSVCESILPDHIQAFISKKDPNNLNEEIQELVKWWQDYFTITSPGLCTTPATQSPSKEPSIDSYEDFLQLKSGTRDTSAQLFIAFLRSCGYETRMVCSLQPISYKPPHTQPIQQTNNDEEKDPVTLFEFKAPFKPYIDPNDQYKQAQAKPPIIWAEVYCDTTESWICVDPIRGHIGKPGRMTPIAHDRRNRISFILALEKHTNQKHGNIVDVTSRYTRDHLKVAKERERPLTIREKQMGGQLWSDLFLNQVCRKNTRNKRDLKEQEELDLRHIHQVMPTSLGAFKNHPLYALERHLKKMEILYELEPVLGYIKSEKIYPRQSVRTLATADTYRKMGREIKQGEQPLKMVKAQGSTLTTKRLQERAKQEGKEVLVPCYGEWQTCLYVPPPIENGKIIKNVYGNMDLFTPTMLPKGASHIPIKGIAKIARKFGIDYADAVVDFEFKRMKSVPVIDGIIVAEENKQILLEAWEEHEQNETRKSIAKQEKESLLRWRKLIKGLIINARIDTEYNQNIWSGYSTSEGGGFLPEEEEDEKD